MLQGESVKRYFEEHPEAKEHLENTEFQFRIWRPGLEHNDMYRMLTVNDVRYITFEGWQGEKGVFAWYYPCGAPHYVNVS